MKLCRELEGLVTEGRAVMLKEVCSEVDIIPYISGGTTRTITKSESSIFGG